MSPYIDQYSLVVLSLIDISTKFIKEHFLKSPSMLAKLLDNCSQLEFFLEFQEPYKSYFDKKRLEISARLNQTVS